MTVGIEPTRCSHPTPCRSREDRRLGAVDAAARRPTLSMSYVTEIIVRQLSATFAAARTVTLTIQYHLLISQHAHERLFAAVERVVCDVHRVEVFHGR